LHALNKDLFFVSFADFKFGSFVVLVSSSFSSPFDLSLDLKGSKMALKRINKVSTMLNKVSKTF
jgi:hypothetical protein